MTTVNKELKLIQKTTEKLLKLIGLEKTTIDVVKQEEVISVHIDCDSPGILIGFKGETIFSLQLILSLMIYKKLGSWQKIVVNVADWREKREESLKNLALNSAQKVKLSGEAIALNNLNAAERRVIHMVLAENADVYTESEGEGTNRRLVIKPKK